ncbi:MAG TPA: flagellar hook-length control protein FliK [Clostridiaceae bacterium]|nr:flagellar hook-length control protein FliK [Clostridiaceae bacterium]
MIQSNSVNAMQLIPQAPDKAKTGKAKGLISRDDTFMNMLNERIAAKKDLRLKGQHVETKNNISKSHVLMDNAKPVNDTKSKPETKKHSDEPKDVTDTSKPEVKKEQEVEGIKKESGRKEEIQKEIVSLEALIALLEELMARLSIKTVSDIPTTSNTPQESILLAESKEISPMELLMALVGKDAVKLKEMMGELGESTNSPGIHELMEKIQSLLEKLDKGQNMPPLKAEIVGESVSQEELIQQLKSQCLQLIDKLNQQVSKLDVSLNQELVREEQDLNESIKVEPGAQQETKDTQNDFTALAKDADSSHVKIAAEMEEPFENIIIQNQIPEGSLSQPISIEKTQLPLSQKPLANTVTNQVMMKVKLMAGENKQEMEIHLKPDSLGRLSLKIIHERGEILAKITTENQQVKEILESNMQMLKDALEESGFNVQSLSVSVGNGKENSQYKENRDGKDKVQSSGLERMTIVSSQADTDRLHLRARIEKEYFNDTSQINMTA